MRKIFIVCMAIAVTIMSCSPKPSNNGTLILKFNPLFGGAPLVLNTQYESPDSKYYTFQHYKFYLSHIKLIHSNGSTVEINPLVYISLDDSYTMNIPSSCPVGSYTGIQFNIGMDSSQNSQPTSADSTSPFYWGHYTTWGNISAEYVFVQVDGLGGSTGSTNAIEYHVGTNPYYTAAPVLSKSFSINGGAQTTLSLNADLQNVFYGNSNAINILTNPVTQTIGDTSALPRTFINDFSQIFSIE